MGMKEEADIAVIGGGPAGIAAAATAARAGCRTILVEKVPLLGGIVSRGGITTLCGLYQNSAATFLHEGFPREFARLVMQRDEVAGPQLMGEAAVLLCRPESFARAAMDLLTAESKLQICLNTCFSGVRKTGRQITAVRCRFGGREYEIKTRAVIDCTGDSRVCGAAGAPLMQPDASKQVPALIFPLENIQGLSLSAAAAARWRMAIARAVSRGELPQAAQYVSFMPSLEPGTLAVKLNLGRAFYSEPGAAGSDPEDRAERLKQQLIRFFRETVPDFAHCTSPAEKSPILCRDSARGLGEYVLGEQDVLSAEKFPDAAAQGCWPIEKWDADGNFSVQYPPAGDFYEIPGRSLRSTAFDNLFLAGKSISAEPDAIASARVVGTCLATGEAAAKMAVRRVGGNGRD